MKIELNDNALYAIFWALLFTMITIVLTVAINRSFDTDNKAIAAGYSHASLPGQTGAQWIKP